MINVRLSGAARTFMLTLQARAAEQDEDEPIIEDAWSADWFSHMPEIEELQEWFNPRFQLATAIRSELIDAAVADFVESHDDDALVVELGAGLSTRYYRLGEPGVTWIEQDLPEVIRVRRKIDVDHERHWFLDRDVLSNEDWLAELPDVDAENTLFIIEATLMFMEEDAVETLFDLLGEHFSGASVVFDVVNPGYIDAAGDQFEELDAPMHWGVAEGVLGKYGVKVEQTDYLLLQHPARWDALGIDESALTKDRSGYVVRGTIK